MNTARNRLWKWVVGAIGVATPATVLAVACGSDPGDIVARAAGTWECELRTGSGEHSATVDVTVDISAAGTFRLTATGGGSAFEGTWDRSGNEVTITSDDSPLFGNELTYEGVTDDPDEVTVREVDGVSGVFDVDIDGDIVVLRQTEFSDGEPAPEEFAFVYTCERRTG